MTYEGKYRLGDAGYGLTKDCLTPYRGVRYHLREWAAGHQAPQNARELYNLRHSKLRNHIERLFGLTKKRFAILTHMPSYSIDTQIDLVMCCFMLHNYIRKYREFNDDESDSDEEDDEDPEDDAAELPNDGAMATLRDAIAQQMWADYQAHH